MRAALGGLADHPTVIVLGVFFLLRLRFLDGFMTHIDDVSVVTGLAGVQGRGLDALVGVLRGGWTYAPAQPVVQAALVRLAADHEGLLFWARLPSLVAWLVGLVLAHRVYRAAVPGRPWVADLLVTVQAVSWRGLIESSQAHNYATTAPVAALLLLWFVRAGEEVQREPVRLADRRPAEVARFFALGIGAGCLVWVTYQALFLAAGGFLGLGALTILRARWRALPQLALRGLLFALPVSAVYLFHLKHVASRGVASWIPEPRPANALDIPRFLARAWFDLTQNVVTFFPWGAGSASLAAIVVLVMVAGAVRAAAARPALDDPARALGAALIGIALVFSTGPLLGLFPLGPTRHGYVLQVPVLVALGLALGALGLGRVPARALTVGVLAIGLVGAASLEARTRRQLDLDGIEGIAAADSEVVVAGLPGQATSDALLLAREHPDWAGRLFASHVDPARLPSPPRRLLLIGHRQAHDEAWFARRYVGYGPPEPIQVVEPVGSAELVGDINGGNGGFIYLLRRP